MKEFQRIWLLLAVAAVFACVGLLTSAGCGDDDDDDDSEETTGVLEFYANGEEFIRDGFTGMTGWRIDFDHFFVFLHDVSAYQEPVEEQGDIEPLHAGHPHEDIPEGAAHAVLLDDHWIDLAQGDDRSLVDSVDDAPIGNYTHVNFSMIQTDSGEYSGYSIVMAGAAVKDSETINFILKFTEQMTFSACHQEVDDEFAGVVEENGVGSVEMTFHSDHVFGDEEGGGGPDGVNEGALGFQPFADLATDGELDIDQDEMSEQLSGSDYLTLIDALRTIGHSGEGHCDYRPYVPDGE